MHPPPGGTAPFLLKVCASGELAEGGVVVRDFARLRLAVYRVNRKLYAIDDVCPHRQGFLSGGPVTDGWVACPLHAWEFELATGCMRGNPAVQIATFPVTEENGVVWVTLAGDPGPMPRV